MEIRVLRRLEERNKPTADEIRALLDRHDVRLLNIMGAPGCGKTTLLEHLLPRLSKHLRCAVLEGDLFTTRDAERIAALGAPVIQLETQGSCHLDAALVLGGLEALPLGEFDLVLCGHSHSKQVPKEQMILTRLRPATRQFIGGVASDRRETPATQLVICRG